MDIDESKKWEEIFSFLNRCDFCETENVFIAKVIVHQVHNRDEYDLPRFSAAVMAKKCWGCCESDSTT